jgi:site-specific DNA-methyltransferase (adenine-specific)
VNNVHFSSATDDWATPQDFFDKIAQRFNFTLDVCADHQNAKCADYYTKSDNGLLKSWRTPGDVWMNPPYGRGIKDWVRKAYEESKGGGNGGLPPTSTHRYLLVA